MCKETTDKNTAIERWKQDAVDKSMAIAGRREAFWQDKDAICRVITYNSHRLNHICLTNRDSKKEVREFMDGCFTAEAIEDLKL